MYPYYHKPGLLPFKKQVEWLFFFHPYLCGFLPPYHTIQQKFIFLIIIRPHCWAPLIKLWQSYNFKMYFCWHFNLQWVWKRRAKWKGQSQHTQKVFCDFWRGLCMCAPLSAKANQTSFAFALSVMFMNKYWCWNMGEKKCPMFSVCRESLFKPGYLYTTFKDQGSASLLFVGTNKQS